MLVQFNMKLIHYTDAPDQLFNLTSDPDELSPLSLPYLSNRMLSGSYFAVSRNGLELYK